MNPEFTQLQILLKKSQIFSGQQQPGVQAGLLTILKGPLEKQPVIFEANSLFVHTVHFQRGDLSYVLKEGDKVTVEVTEFSGGKERKRMFAKVRIKKSQFHYYLFVWRFLKNFDGIAVSENQALIISRQIAIDQF